MADKTLNERVYDLEAVGRSHVEQFAALNSRIDHLLSTVVLVEKRKPGPAQDTVRKKRRPKIKVKPGFKRPRKIDPDNLPMGVTIA